LDEKKAALWEIKWVEELVLQLVVLKAGSWEMRLAAL
jgi:hypothetical protein